MDQWLADYLVKEQKLIAEQQRTAQEAVSQLARAAADFKHRRGVWPRSLDELKPSLPNAQVPFDPWNQLYQYACPGLFNVGSFDVYSFCGNSREPAGWIGNWETPFRLAGAVEGESLPVSDKTEDARASVQELTNRSVPPLSGGKHLFLRFSGPGDQLTLTLPDSLKPGRYNVFLSTVTSWDYGLVQWTLDGQALGAPLDGHSPDMWRRVTAAPAVTLAGGPHQLQVRVVGRHPCASGFAASLDAILLRPAD